MGKRHPAPSCCRQRRETARPSHPDRPHPGGIHPEAEVAEGGRGRRARPGADTPRQKNSPKMEPIKHHPPPRFRRPPPPRVGASPAGFPAKPTQKEPQRGGGVPGAGGCGDEEPSAGQSEAKGRQSHAGDHWGSPEHGGGKWEGEWGANAPLKMGGARQNPGGGQTLSVHPITSGDTGTLTPNVAATGGPRPPPNTATKPPERDRLGTP